jgi:hypothetical protein
VLPFIRNAEAAGRRVCRSGGRAHVSGGIDGAVLT